MISYDEFLERKSQLGGQSGFKSVWLPDFLFDFQKAIVDRALFNGKYAVFADCGLGKTPMQLIWSENVCRKTGGQHCAHVVTFASHSYEQYYQSVRRCWRFGQQSPVKVDVIASEGEKYVAENMNRKAVAAAKMFENLIDHMNNATRIERGKYTLNPELPAWIKAA